MIVDGTHTGERRIKEVGMLMIAHTDYGDVVRHAPLRFLQSVQRAEREGIGYREEPVAFRVPPHVSAKSDRATGRGKIARGNPRRRRTRRFEHRGTKRIG